MVANGKGALDPKLIVVIAVGQIQVCQLHAPTRKLALVKGEITAIALVVVLGAVRWPINDFDLIIAEACHPLRIDAEIVSPCWWP